MHRLDTVTLPDNHTIAECWHPHLHKSPFKKRSAQIVASWYNRQGYRDENGMIRRASPVCVFGGTTYCPHVLNEHASETYAVCPSCKKVMMCGWNDGLTHPRPKCCETCKVKFGLNDYFQPIFPRSYAEEENLADPACDPAVTIAETCALVTDGISFRVLPTIVAVLTDENLLRTGKFVGDIKATSNSIMPMDSKSIDNCLLFWGTDWACIDPRTSRVKVTDHGRTMLSTRNITPITGAAERVNELISFKRIKLAALALRLEIKHLESAKA